MNSHEARPLVPNPLGKCTQSLELTIPVALEERLITMAALKGVAKSTYARQILERALYGEFVMMQMMAHGAQDANPDNSR